ncbi:hypothetical protein GKZ28_05375 [Clostridium chromiireducens]|uniref:Uncharacterized protein n=1 Tax=Clostridium chromiireducens TaxID=225345 RepID=A0A964W1J2_9CLOT|nr:hypothetical protein [Clostridium chromiireducens]MVX63128.1 hypothetical protein [Clostridium chromiireducens]
MLDLIALLCLISIPLLVVIIVISFIAAFISIMLKNTEVKLIKKDDLNI